MNFICSSVNHLSIDFKCCRRTHTRTHTHMDNSAFLTKLPTIWTHICTNQVVPLFSWIVSTGQFILVYKSFHFEFFLVSFPHTITHLQLCQYSFSSKLCWVLFVYFWICHSFTLSLLHWIVVQVIALTTKSQCLFVQLSLKCIYLFVHHNIC